MGNALEFTKKFENIALYKETQNFEGVWLEYGDLLHIIWDFQPLEEGARSAFEQYMAQYVPNNEYSDFSDPVDSYIALNSLGRFANYLDAKAARA
jgi:hypothetical protein